MYRRKLNKWGFEKRIKVSEAEFILRRWIERGSRGKHSEFRLRGGPVYTWTISDRIKKSAQEIMSSESYGAATPPHLRCSTPDPATWMAESSADILQEYAEEVEAYKGAPGIGNSTAEPQPQEDASPKVTASNRDSPERERQALS